MKNCLIHFKYIENDLMLPILHSIECFYNKRIYKRLKTMNLHLQLSPNQHKNCHYHFLVTLVQQRKYAQK